MELTNASLLYLISGNYTHYFLLITILNISGNSIIVNMTEISHNISLSYIVAYPSFLLFIPNATQNAVAQYDNIDVNIVNLYNFTIYVDTYNGIVIHYTGKGINATLIGATVPLEPNVYKPIPSYILNKSHSSFTIIEYETLFLTISLVISFYIIFEKASKK
ncbi:hypothetical protein V6M85_04855 [Sulfolobus tengchongensis]|uniref:Uncharacterized protein n=1 Tax=Sulfolobus tengchongensis TaxID=207809 RepID=A0AAX4L2H6_9CREN